MPLVLVPVPPQSEIPEFPSLSDRATGTYNTKAYDWATKWRSVVAPELRQIALSAYSNAQLVVSLAGQADDDAEAAAEAKRLAVEAALTAAAQAAISTTQADQAMGYRNAANNSAGLAATAKGQAEAAASTSTTQAGLSAAARLGSEEARDTALSLAAFAFEATSTTNLAIGLGAKAFAIAAGKSFAVGQYVSAVSVADPSVWMSGPVTAHDRATGQITLQVNATMGAGTLANWRLVLAANGAAAGVQAIAAGTYTDADLAPLNSVTVITGVNSAYATTHLPVITASSGSAGWGTSYDWVVETLGFGAGAGIRATQTAVPSVVANALGTGLRFARKKVGATWGRWKPIGAFPTSVLTIGGSSDMYGDGQLGNNRINQIAASGVAANWYLPPSPEDGDRCYFFTNSRSDNAVFYKDKNVIGNGVVLSTSTDNVKLNKPFSKFGFAYNLFNDSWMIE